MKKPVIALAVVAISVTCIQCAFADPASTSPAAATPPTTGAAADAPEPMMKERIKINDLINEARKRNIGVTGYVTKMEEIEDKAFAGASEAELKPLITDLTAKLNEQLQQSVALKNYKPAPLSAQELYWRNEERKKEKRMEDYYERCRMDDVAATEMKYRTVSRSTVTNNKQGPNMMDAKYQKRDPAWEARANYLGPDGMTNSQRSWLSRVKADNQRMKWRGY